jgi:hypothetical protein
MPLHGILMNIVSMMNEIHPVANSMIGESALPDLALSANDSAKLVRICAFDQLNGPLDGYVRCRREQQVNVLGHDDERVQSVAALAAMPIECLQEEPHVRFNDEQLAAIPRREGQEISSKRGEESSRLQGKTSAAESRTSFQTLNWHEWNSCPSRLFFVLGVSFRERKYDAAK